MLVEGLLVAGAVTKIGLIFTEEWRIKRRKIKNIKYRWDFIMRELNIKSKYSNYTFHIVNVEPINNGYTLTVHVPTGLTYKELESKKEAMESAYKGMIIMEQIRFSSLIKIKLINKDIGKFEFEPVKAYPNQIYIGQTFDNKPYFIDTNLSPHILIGGTTGTGKTFLLATILTNLIYNSNKSVEIHLSQILKGEIGLFAKCKGVKFVGNNLKEVAIDLTRVAAKVDSRSRKFTELGVKNLQHHNKHYPKSKMKRIYYIIEEISFFMPQDTDDEDTKTLKAKCWENILLICKAGRSSSVHLISVLQRSTVTNLPSDVKSQLCRVTMQQISSIDSRNIIECDDAVNLKRQECLVYGTPKTMQIIKTPYVDEDFRILNKYVPEIKIPNAITVMSDEDRLNKPILVNDGIAKELPLYIKPEKSEILSRDNRENSPFIEKTKPKKKMRKGMIEEN